MAIRGLLALALLLVCRRSVSSEPQPSDGSEEPRPASDSGDADDYLEGEIIADGTIDSDVSIDAFGTDGTDVAATALVFKSAGSSVPAVIRILNHVRSTTPEELKHEIIAAELALALRAEVDGAVVIYDSPAVSIALRKVSEKALIEGTKIEAPDGSSVQIPADPRVKGRYGGPVTVSLTSYHAGDAVKELPTVKYGAQRRLRRVGGRDSATVQQEDRVDFFMSRTSVSWRGTVNVKVPGLAAQVPAHDRPWRPFGENETFAAEKAEVRQELERLVGQPSAERLRGYRKLARKWHPDKCPEEKDRATAVFEYLQELRQALLGSSRVAAESREEKGIGADA